MIKEDYVSFETAKLLKERGFECEKNSITAMYNELGVFLPLSTAAEELYRDYNDFDEYDYIAPTLQMAMKWLRVVHNIQIVVNRYPAAINAEARKPWYTEIVILKPVNEVDEEFDLEDDYNTYEEACEAAIKYCLENLI